MTEREKVLLSLHGYNKNEHDDWYVHEDSVCWHYAQIMFDEYSCTWRYEEWEKAWDENEEPYEVVENFTTLYELFDRHADSMP